MKRSVGEDFKNSANLHKSLKSLQVVKLEWRPRKKQKKIEKLLQLKNLWLKNSK